MTVIGIHKNTDSKKANGGTFIGEIINEINNDLSQGNKDDNYIIGEIKIKSEDVNKKIRIINSYEEYMRNNEYSLICSSYELIILISLLTFSSFISISAII